MAGSASRPGVYSLQLLFALLFLAASGLVDAGELFRPVPPDAQVTHFTRFNLRYTLRDVVADSVRKVEFYITEDMGRTWRLYGEDPTRTSPMTIQVPGEGVYGFVSVTTDRFGNREREPGPRTRPETVVIVDRTPPQAKWLAPLQDILSKNGTVEFSWESSDLYYGPTPVTIQYAHNAAAINRNAPWQTLKDKLPPSGSIVLTLPEDASGRYNFRLVAEDRAGNQTFANNPATLIIDSAPPRVTAVSPLKSNKLDVDIRVEADDGPDGSGVKNISLYASENRGILWELLKERNENGESTPVLRGPGDPIPFKAGRSGEYALWPVVFDRAENVSPLPAQGVPGPFILVIDTEPPTVTLSNSFLQGRGALLANEARIVEWTSYDPHPKEGGAAIHLSQDNGKTWQEIRVGLSPTGSAVVNFPLDANSEEAMLKATVEDDFGNVGEGLSQTFRISPADTVITNVVSVDNYIAQQTMPPSGGSSFYQPDDFDSQPPMIPPPPGSTIPPPAPIETPDMGGYPTFDPYTRQPGMTVGEPPVYMPPSAIDPYSVPPPGSPLYPESGVFVPDPGETGAGSFPSAMINSAVQSRQPIYTPPTSPAPTVQWNPTPAPETSGMPSSSTQPPAAIDPFAPPSGFPGFDSEPAPEVSAPPVVPAIPPPVASAGPPAPPNLAPPTDSFSPFDAGQGIDMAPPPLIDQTPPAVAPPVQQPFSFDSFGDTGLTPPPLPSEAGEGFGLPATPQPSVGFGEAPATPPAIPVQPETPPAPVVQQPAFQTAQPVPEAVASGIFDMAPQEVAPLPPIDSAGLDEQLRPPPIGQGGMQSDPRQLSNHYADEAKNYLEEGRLDLALDSANRAMSADGSNAVAYSRLAQVLSQQEPPNFPRAAALAREATNIGRDWYSWWTCADVFYRWAHVRNRMVQNEIRSGQRPSPDILDERNQAMNNAQIAVGNAARLVQAGSGMDQEQVAMSQGEITYLRALSIPEPVRPAPNAPAALQDDYRRSLATYKTSVTPILLEALPYFQTAMQLGGSPTYRETFHMGIISFRLGGLERDTGNMQVAAQYYEAAARYLEEATIASLVPAEGPREAYYMLAFCHDQLSEQPGRDRARHKEMALRYWRRTAEFYLSGTAYRDYAEQRIMALQQELGL